MSSLIRIVPWSQQLVCEVLQPGDLAVDLTAGKGRDTLTLAKAVGPSGQILAFDIQPSALDQTASFLNDQGVSSQRWSAEESLPEKAGVYLVQACHATLSDLIDRPIKAAIANLGYLPGGDRSLVTGPQSTLPALHQTLDLLSVGGRLAVTIYPGHPGGSEEACAVEDLLNGLSRELWQILGITVNNRPEAPRLLVAERVQSRL
jgi:hypothetical protein